MSLVPPRIRPPEQPLRGMAFLAAFVRNPLEVVPRVVYEQDIFVNPAGQVQRLWITAPELVKTVLLDEREKYQKQSQIRLLAPLLGKGILTSEGEYWKWQRQASAPMFRHQDLLGFVPTFVHACDRLVARWRTAPPGAVQPIDRDMTHATFDVISASLLPSTDATVGSTVEKAMGLFQRAGGWNMLLAMMGVPRWVPRPGMFYGMQAISMLRTVTDSIVRERRRADAAGGAVADDLLHRLMRAKDPETGRTMNRRQLVDNLLTFYLAGHETTARALAWTLFLLSRSPDWSARLEEEIERVTGGAPVQSAHVEKLVLVQQVIKESMRLFPPVPLLSRQAVVPARLGGLDIAPGATVVMPIYAMHRHEKRWPDPHNFDPTRFAPGREAEIPRYQYLPFGAGPRICIGMAFAMLEATVMLATLLQHARFATSGDADPVPVARVTLQPRDALTLRVSLR